MDISKKSNEDIAYIGLGNISFARGQREKLINKLNSEGKHISDEMAYTDLQNNPVFVRLVNALDILGYDKAYDFIFLRHHSGGVDYIYTGQTFKKMNQ